MDAEITHTMSATYAQLSFLIEANDYVAGVLMRRIGPRELLALIHRVDWYPRDLKHLVEEELGVASSSSSRVSFEAALRRWRQRLPYAPPALKHLDIIREVGGGLLTPADKLWPKQLNDLGYGAPLCLWWRSKDPTRLASHGIERNVGIVGSRDSSDYGNQITVELAGELAQRGICVISGGAYGIDAAAHRAALQAERSITDSVPTIGIMAGGLDRLYPAGNHQLLRQIIDQGILLSEVPPGTAPARFRFLNRNRLIAAFCHLIVVTEARFRSGALNTARQAVDLGREVAAVPGSVFSPNSVGTHRLIRSGEAGLITNIADALELLPALLPEVPQQLSIDHERATDGLNPEQALLLDVLSRTQALTLDELCARSGVPVPVALTALHYLKLRNQASDLGSTWKRVGK
ncbi:DNA-processing protein DprA [Glutamicibacter uratoxydans]|uniref:DNA-processing protein DprA n=1 Tax=Glutamicibacter uratoxydans TaxID=43667 RepID=UPI003D6ECA81